MELKLKINKKLLSYLSDTQGRYAYMMLYDDRESSFFCYVVPFSLQIIYTKKFIRLPDYAQFFAVACVIEARSVLNENENPYTVAFEKMVLNFPKHDSKKFAYYFDKLFKGKEKQQSKNYRQIKLIIKDCCHG